MKNHAVITLVLAFVTSALLAQVPDAKQVEVFTQKISYLESGTGAPVILLHGLGASKNVWRLTIPALAPAFHIYAPDQIGFGASEKPPINYRVATLTDFLEEFMRKLEIPKATLVGNSLGGWVAADFAIRHPEKVDRLVLVDSAGYFPRPVARSDMTFLNPATLEETRELVKRVFFNKQMQNDTFVRFLYTEHLRAGDGYSIERFIDSVLRHEDYLNDRLSSIKASTMVLSGKEDPLIPAADFDAMGRQITGARRVVLDNCGHVPQFECAAAFEKALLDFLGAK